MKTVTREDGKVFQVVFLSHWSDIRADDGETDSIKCYGGHGNEEWFISANKGFKYTYTRPER